MMTPASRSAAGRRAYVNANIVAPAQGLNGKGGILIEGGWILAVGPKVTRETAGSGTAIIDCSGLTLVPGLIDMHNHLGPGETIPGPPGPGAAPTRNTSWPGCMRRARMLPRT